MNFLLLNLFLLILTQSLLIFKHGSILKSINLINIPWILFSYISTLGLYDLYIPSESTLLLVFFFILFLNLCFFLYPKIKNKHNYYIQIIKPRIVFILFINFLAYSYMLSFLPKIIQIIQENGFANLRSFAFDSSLGLATTTELLIFQNIIAPVFLSTIIISLTYFPLKRYFLLLFLAIFNVAIYTLFFAGRYFIFQLGFYFLFSIFLYNFKFFKSLRINFLISIIFIIVVFLVLFITELRSSNSDFLETIVVYFSGPFIFLDYVIRVNPFNNNLFWGGATFGFIYNIVVSIITLLFNIEFFGTNHLITQFTGIPIFISPTIGYFNSMTTILFPFIVDFGYFSIVFASIFLSYLIYKFDKFYANTYNGFSKSLYLFFLFIIFNSILYSNLLFPSTGMIFIFIFIFYDFSNFKNLMFLLKNFFLKL